MNIPRDVGGTVQELETNWEGFAHDKPVTSEQGDDWTDGVQRVT